MRVTTRMNRNSAPMMMTGNQKAEVLPFKAGGKMSIQDIAKAILGKVSPQIKAQEGAKIPAGEVMKLEEKVRTMGKTYDPQRRGYVEKRQKFVPEFYEHPEELPGYGGSHGQHPLQSTGSTRNQQMLQSMREAYEGWSETTPEDAFGRTYKVGRIEEDEQFTPAEIRKIKASFALPSGQSYGPLVSNLSGNIPADPRLIENLNQPLVKQYLDKLGWAPGKSVYGKPVEMEFTDEELAGLGFGAKPDREGNMQLFSLDNANPLYGGRTAAESQLAPMKQNKAAGGRIKIKPLKGQYYRDGGVPAGINNF